jgi:hypothetical protein
LENGSSSLQKKVDNILLVRFGSLSSEEQRILRKASIIGVSFGTSVLRALLAPQLEEHFTEHMRSLVAGKWLHVDLVVDDAYQFAHAHARQIVFELTPSSERNVLHQLIADLLVGAYPVDPSMYFALWYHYQHCDNDKALQYAVRATTVMLETEDIFEYGECLDLLQSTVKCAKTLNDIYVLQCLMNRLSNRVADWDDERAVAAYRSHTVCPWALRTQTSLGRIKVAPSHKAFRGTSAMHMDGFASIGSHSDAGSVSETGTQECPHALLSEQLELFCHLLSARALELADHTACTACTVSQADSPPPWQLAYLNIRL